MAGYIGTTPVPQATQHRESFTATGGQTSFATVGYTPQFIDVYLNGVKLASADFTATNGSDVVLASGATASDILEIVAYTPFEVANQTFTGTTTAANLTVTGAFTSQGIDDNADAVAITIDSSENVGIGTSSPAADLHVNSGASNLAGLFESTDAGATITLIDNGTTGGSAAEHGLNTVGNQLEIRAVDNLSFETAGSEAMRIDSTGSVGIGTSSPARTLEVYSSAPAIKLNNGTNAFTIGTGAFVDGSNSLVFFDEGVGERMRIDSSGTLLVGTTDTNIVASSTATDEGFVYVNGAALTAARSAGQVADFNRISNDGEIVRLRKDGTNVGAIGVYESDRLYIADQSNGLQFDQTIIRPCNSTGANTDDVVTLGSSGSRFKDLYLSGSVVFGDAGGSGTSTSNSLDSYEEGTWQPVAADSFTGGNTTTTGQGFYTKIGRLVVVTCDITNINTTGLTLTNSFYVQGLPFANNGAVRSTATLQVNLINKGDGLFAHLAENGTSFSFKYNDDSKNNTASGLFISDLKDDQSDMFGITLVYHTAT